MLPKKNRTNKKLVEKIFKEGRFFNSPNLSLKFIIINKESKRISFIAPKTISKKAVDRNILKRRGYYILEKYFSKFPVGISGVFIFGKKSMEIFGGKKNKKRNPTLSLEEEIKSILEKLKN